MQGNYNFLKLKKVILRNFSLYKKDGKIYEVSEDVNEGVYCLIGANGLGKTTFLNAINYGLTGIVLEPNKEVFSPSEIVTRNKKYTERYFIGRVAKKDEEEAEIELLFTINGKSFRIIRSFFELEHLRLLEVFSTIGSRKVSHFKSKDESPKELCNHFQKSLALEIGFNSFDYFIFYQLYVFTFDENRRMLFWDDRASYQALAIVFNSSPDDADKILELSRKIERHDSKGRNLKYQSTLSKKKAEELIRKTNGKKASDIEKLESQYEKLYTESEETERILNNIKIEFDSMLKKQSYLNSEIMQLRIEHTRLFSKYSKPRSKLLENTNIQLSIKKHECCLCGSAGSLIVENIERNIHKEKCPLCNTNIKESDNNELDKILELIHENDNKIAAKNSELDNLILEVEGKRDEVDKAEIEYTKSKKKIEEFSEDNSDVSFKGIGNNNLNSLIEQYLNQSKLSDDESKGEYAKRDKLKPAYENLLRKVETAYKDAETVFVPTFKKLAKSFIGLDLNIQSRRTDKSFKLVLELQDLARTESFQLSESQRFFLDIALRMALTIFLSNKKNQATMFIDTPEGSLDIAYEGRVGDMFAEYVTLYRQNLFMTANINASQLLLSLAAKCGNKNMKFRRMLEWTDLSAIQKEGESLFRRVYLNIEKALNVKEN